MGENLLTLLERFHFPISIHKTLHDFIICYQKVLKEKGLEEKSLIEIFEFFFEDVQKELLSPTKFESIHKQILSPIDYYQNGLEFVKPLIDFSQSSVEGKEHWIEIQDRIQKKENVILVSNHQIELDPQVLTLMLSSIGKAGVETIKEGYFVAGERVITDPMAIFFSKGRNLICVYSKKYVAEDKKIEAARRLHNLKTIKQLRQMLDEGGYLIWVALSGGRDRANPEGIVTLSPFDSSTLALFLLLQKKAKQSTAIYPMTLATYNIMPPPEKAHKTLGEKRWTKGSSVQVNILPEFIAKETTEEKITQELYEIMKKGYTPIIANVEADR